MRRSRVVAAVLLVTLLPASGALGLERDDELGDARRELDSASRELSDIEAAVRRTSDEVAALDLELRDASTRLERVQRELADAREDQAEASAAERLAAGELADVDAALDDALDTWTGHRSRLADRAVHAFKHGPGTTADVLVRGVTGSDDWHGVAVTLEIVDRVSEDDATLVESSVTSARTTADLRARVGDARREALDSARTAAQEARRVEELHAAQQALVDDVDSRLARRREVLAGLEQDAAARAVLVRELEERVSRLELRASTVFVPIQVDLDVHGEPPAWARGLPDDGSTYGAAIEATAARHGLDGRLLAALVWTESGFRADAVSHAGALGLAQLMPATARGLGVEPRDPLQNLDGGARYLRAQLDRFGRVDLALAAYNAGPGRVERAGAVPDIVETQLYVVRVLERYERLTAA